MLTEQRKAIEESFNKRANKRKLQSAITELKNKVDELKKHNGQT